MLSTPKHKRSKSILVIIGTPLKSNALFDHHNSSARLPRHLWQVCERCWNLATIVQEAKKDMGTCSDTLTLRQMYPPFDAAFLPYTPLTNTAASFPSHRVPSLPLPTAHVSN